jgi:hypothetical protein
MKKRPLQVSLRVKLPSLVEFTVGDRVQLDRLVVAPNGYLAERHGELLSPGVTALAQGDYFFKTLSHAHLKVIYGGVDTVLRDGKDLPPPVVSGSVPSPPSRGDAPSGETPMFTIEQVVEP